MVGYEYIDSINRLYSNRFIIFQTLNKKRTSPPEFLGVLAAVLQQRFAVTVCLWKYAVGIYSYLRAAPDGIEATKKTRPNVDIFVGAPDEEQNARKYIVPGFEDAWDREFKNIINKNFILEAK